jgi:glutamine synthetase
LTSRPASPIGATAGRAGSASGTGVPARRDLTSSSEPEGTFKELVARDVRVIAVTMVDNAGIARAKAVPIEALERSLRWGVGLSPVFDVCTVADTFTSSPAVGGPTGDLRLIPDPSAMRICPERGWATAPADQYTQDGEVFGCCQRSFARRMVQDARARGLELRFGWELEWFLGQEADGSFLPAHAGPGYGFSVLAELSSYARELVECFVASGVHIGQIHPEYAPGQLEISLPPSDPVASADLSVFARHAIRAVSIRNGWRASFSPVVMPEQVGNGGHLHVGVLSDGRNLLAGGQGPHGMTDVGESFLAGVLAQLPALMAIGSPSVASYVRLQPSMWAGAYACWGRENREAAMRFVTGMDGSQQTAANCEVKCFDQSANPYLVTGAVIAAGLEGLDRGLTLPPEVNVDPAALTPRELEAAGAGRLPTSLGASIAALERSEPIRAAMGAMLFDAVLAVRRAELETFGEADADTILAAHRWRY